MLIVNGMMFQQESIPVEGYHVGYIYRWRQSPRYGEKEDCGHSGCILPHGQLVGFGYDPEEALLNGSNMQQKLEKGLRGRLCFNEELPPRYTEIKRAIATNTQSSFLLIEANSYQISLFKSYWTHILGNYNHYTRNCSTVCYEALRSAELVKFSFIPIITPKNLYHLLLDTCHERNLKFLERTGYLGIEQKGQNKWNLNVARKSE